MSEQILKNIRKMLKDGIPWPPELSSRESYSRLQDDHDGTEEGIVTVTFSPDGDAWLWTDIQKSLRFRTSAGGGRSIMVRNALVLLALAIKLENDEQERRNKQ